MTPRRGLDWAALLAWYAGAARDLPWRRADATPWAVLVSEVMLQQTPVSRVRPAFDDWIARWPTPGALAADPAGEAVRQWGRLGYPRRALRLHAAARRIVEVHAAKVPDDVDALQALPGVGAYTARAVAAFAYHRRALPLDTNVRRVLARAVQGRPQPSASAAGTAEQRAADGLVPPQPAAARAAAAVMELGALICTARAPRCGTCPIAGSCAWLGAGARRAAVGQGRRIQRYAGTDRQVRGALLALLRQAPGPVDLRRASVAADTERRQRARALDSLVADGLVAALPDGRFTLPT